MRQAGRILKEYRDVRSQFAGFKEFVKNPEACCEVTIQPVDILGVDAAIIFSDILVIPEAMGCDYEMIESKGPSFPKTIQTQSDIDSLKIASAQDLSYVIDAIRLTRSKLNPEIPLIGFAGAPFTIAAYMLEGSGSKTFSKAKKFLYTEEKMAHELLQKITASTIAYLQAQAQEGAQLLQIFDSWAGILSPTQYEAFGLKYISDICTALQASHPHIPLTVFSKGAYFAHEKMSQLACQTIGLDWNMSIEKSKNIFTHKTLQGNFDPCLLYASHDIIKAEIKRVLAEVGTHPYIANLGHGLYPDTPVDNVKYFIDEIKKQSLKK